MHETSPRYDMIRNWRWDTKAFWAETETRPEIAHDRDETEMMRLHILRRFQDGDVKTETTSLVIRCYENG